MYRELAQEMEKSLGISAEQVVREEYEMIILKALFESEVGSAFVFKGGTALRLAFGSPRYSEDLDFSVIKDIDEKEVGEVLKDIAKGNQALSLVETILKRFTYFALFRVNESFLTYPFSIKFEASTRPVNWKKGRGYTLRALSSKVTNLSVLAQVATLESIEKEKRAIKPRRIRDIFDLWLIGQRLGRSTRMNFGKWKAKTVKRELHKFLPKKDRQLLEQWLPKE